MRGSGGGWSLRVRIAALLAATLVPLMGLGAYWALWEARHERARAEREAREMAPRIAAQAAQRITGIQQMLVLLTRVPAVRAGERGRTERLLQDHLADSPHLEDIGLSNAEGTLLLAARAPAGEARVSFRDRLWFQAVLQTRQPVASGFQIGRISGRPLAVLAAPVLDRQGDVLGVVSATLRLAAVRQEVAPPQPGTAAGWAVVDGQGLVLLHGDPRVAPGQPLEAPRGMLRADAIVPGTAWRAVVHIPEAAIASRARAALVRIGLPAMLVLLAATAVGLWIAYGTWWPLRDLAEAARSLGAGELGRRVREGAPGEVGELARAFNEMADRRQQSEAALKRSLVLRDALAGLSAAIAEATERENILRRVVSATRQLLGAPYAVLWVLSPAGTDFTVAAEEVDPSLGPLPSQAAFPLAGSFAETIIGEGRPVALPDVRQNPRWQNASWAGLEQLVSYVAVPLVREAGLVGFLAAMDRLGRAFTEEEMEVLRSLGTHAALAVEKAGLLEGARKAAERAQALVDVGKILTATLDLNSVLDLIVDKVVAVTGAGRCGIARLTPTGQLEYIRAKGFDDSVPPVFSRGEGLIGRCLEMGAPVWSRNVLEDPAITLRPEMRAQTQSRGALAVPIVTPQAPYGVLYIGRRQPHDHTAGEIAFAEALAAQAAIAIENASLYEESQRRAAEAEALAEVGRALSASLETDKVLNLVVQGVQRVMGVPYVQLLSLDEAGRYLTFVRGAGFDPAQMARVRLTLGEGITGRAVEQGISQQSTDLLEDPRFLSLGLAEAMGIRSLLAVPLRVGGRALGALVALRKDRHVFTPPEIQLLERFADQAAIAIQNARLFAEEQKRRRQVEAVRAVTAEIARELDLPTVLELIYRKAVELVGGTSGGVLLWEERSQVLVPQAWIGYGDWMKEVRIKLGEGAAGTAALRREGLIVHDYRNWPDAIPVFADRSGFTTTLAEPLLYGDRLLGVIVVNSEGAGEQFTPQHRETISLFASQAAIAIENARLYAQAREALRQVEALYEAGQAVTESLNLDATLTRIVENARRLAGADRAFLWVAEDGAASLRAGIATGPGAETFVGTRIPAGSGSTAALAFGECRTVTVEDMALSTEFDRGLAARFGNAALVAVPLRLHEAISAVLVCGYNQPRRFESAEVELLTGLGRHAAIALENSHLYAEAERRRREAEEALAQVKRLQGLLPICSYCKKIRDDKNYWQQVEHYVAEHSEAQFSHGICPECYQKVAKPALERLRRSARNP